MNLTVFNQENQEVGTVEVDDRIFSCAWNPVLVQQVLQSQRANKRNSWAHARDRSEVRGGGRKPWRQKGTGRARHGSIRSPLWVGGGKAHGPRKGKSYKKKVNKKMRRAAVRSVLAKKHTDGEVKVIESFSIEEPKTRLAESVLRNVIEGEGKDGGKLDVLIVRGPEQKLLPRAVRNIPKANVVEPDMLNIDDLLGHKTVLFEQSALDKLDYLNK